MDKIEDVHVLAGALKLFFRELPDPLLPYTLHSDLVSASKGHGIHGGNIAESLETILDKLDVVERDTLEVVLKHLGKVSEADNKMDVDNLAIVFGQVLLWPDPSIPVGFAMVTGTALCSSFNIISLFLLIFRVSKECWCRGCFDQI